MWTVVYIASNHSIAKHLKEALADEGVLVMLRAAGSPQVGEAGSVEILVPESEAEEAHEIISNKLSS